MQTQFDCLHYLKVVVTARFTNYRAFDKFQKGIREILLSSQEGFICKMYKFISLYWQMLNNSEFHFCKLFER